MTEYNLLSGKTVDLSALSEEGQEHVSLIEKLVADSEDYFEVYRQAFVPLMEGKLFNAESLHRLHESSRYRVVFDLVERYRQKLFEIKG